MTKTDEPIDGPEAIARDRRRWHRAIGAAGLAALAILWVHLAAQWFGADFRGLGVVPREAMGLVGVLLAPLIHGSWGHVGSNAIALVVLGTLSAYAYPRTTARAVPLIWLLAGLGTWLIGRDSVHIGASGITHGLMAMIALLGVLRWEPRAIMVALVTFLLYGGMVWGVLPGEAGISWESHLSGAIAGLLAAIVWRDLDPRPPRRRWSWEVEAEIADELARRERAEYELPRPEHVPVLWRRKPDSGDADRDDRRVVPFRRPGRPDIDADPPTDTRH